MDQTVHETGILPGWEDARVHPGPRQGVTPRYLLKNVSVSTTIISERGQRSWDHSRGRGAETLSGVLGRAVVKVESSPTWQKGLFDAALDDAVRAPFGGP
jgi:hypothetical protein